MRSQYNRQLLLLLTAVLIEYLVLWTVVYKVKADNFFPIANIEETQLQVKSLFSIEHFSNESNVTFDSLAVKGKASEVLLQKTYGEIAMLDEQEIRQVSVPGGTVLNLLWVPENNTGHQVYLHNAWLFGKEYSLFGRNVVSYYDIAYFSGGQLLHRYGQGVQYGPLGNVLTGYQYKARVLDTFTVDQPIEVLGYKVVCREVEGDYPVYEYSLEAKNNSNFPEIITVGDGEYLLSGGEVHTVSGVVGQVSMIPKELVVHARDKVCFDNSDPLMSFWVSRNDSLYWFWGGVQAETLDSSPEEMPLCVTRITYKVSLGRLDDCVSLKRYTFSVEEAGGVMQIFPPSTATFNLKVELKGGGDVEESQVKMHYLSELFPFVEKVEGDIVESESLVRRVHLIPGEENELLFAINFPDKLPRELFESTYITFEFNGVMKKVALQLMVNELESTEGKIVQWCGSEHGEILVDYINKGNVLHSDVEQELMVSKEATISINGGQSLYVKRILLRYESQLQIRIFNRQELDGGYLEIGGFRLDFPVCSQAGNYDEMKGTNEKPKLVSPITVTNFPVEERESKAFLQEGTVEGVRGKVSLPHNYSAFYCELAIFFAIAITVLVLYKTSFARKRR